MDYRCDVNEFNRICLNLAHFGEIGQERIVFDEQNRPTLQPRACWLSRVISYIKRFFCCDVHPAEPIARRIVDFLTVNSSHIQAEHIAVISKLSAIKCTNWQTQRVLTEFFNSAVRAHEELVSAQQKVEQARREIPQQHETAERQRASLSQEAETKAAAILAAARQQASEKEHLARELEKAAAGSTALEAEAKRECDDHRSRVQQEAKRIHDEAEQQKPRVYADAEKAREKEIFSDFILHLTNAKFTHKTLFQEKELMDVVLVGDDLGEVRAHSLVLQNVSGYFAKLLTEEVQARDPDKKERAAADRKETAAAKPTESFKLSFEEHQIKTATIEKFIAFVYREFNDLKLTIEECLELYRFAFLVEAEQELTLINEAIRTIIAKQSQMIFKIVPQLDKSHPAVPLLLHEYIAYKLWRSWSDVPKAKLEEFVTFVLAYETADCGSYLQEPKIATSVAEIFLLANHVNRAVQLLENAANDSSSFAGLRLALHILDEVNRTENVDAKERDANRVDAEKSRAIKLIQNSLNSKDPLVLRHANYLMATFEFLGKYGTKVDKEAAREKLKKHPYPPAQVLFFLVGYDDGDYEGQEERAKLMLKERCRLIKEAADGGLLKAQSIKAGLGVNPKYKAERYMAACLKLKTKESIEMLKHAAVMGDSVAQCFLGELYEKGMPRHIDVDIEHARIWYQKSVAQGFCLAKEQLAKLDQPRA